MEKCYYSYPNILIEFTGPKPVPEKWHLNVQTSQNVF